MATEIDKERIAGKLLLDSDFRKAFASDPSQAALGMGIELNPQEIEKLQAFDKGKLDSMSKMLDESMRPNNLPFPTPPTPIGNWGKPPPPIVISDIVKELDGQ